MSACDGVVGLADFDLPVPVVHVEGAEVVQTVHLGAPEELDLAVVAHEVACVHAPRWLDECVHFAHPFVRLQGGLLPHIHNLSRVCLVEVLVLSAK